MIKSLPPHAHLYWTALYKHWWELQMQEILCLCHTIVNGPLPPSTLWQASAEVILRTLGLPEPSSFPTSEEYSKFVLMPLTNQLAATAEANLEDDHELCNEISTLKRLEVGMHAEFMIIFKIECADFIAQRSEEHTSELQSHSDLVCRLLLEKKKIKSVVYREA